jgi:head-tail adaptor
MATSGSREHRITLKNPSLPVPDGVGGFYYTWIPLNPSEVDAEIRVGPSRNLERDPANTVMASNTYQVTIAFHPEVTTQTRIWWERGAFNVTGVRDVDLRGVDMELTCEDVLS